MIIGDGSRKAEPKTLTTERGISESVRFTGKMTRNDLYDIMDNRRVRDALEVLRVLCGSSPFDGL